MHKKIRYIRIMSAQKLLKGSLQTIILKLLEEKDRMYGYEICKKVKDLSEGEFNITEGALYPALHKLETEGLLSVEIEMVGNRKRKYYSITKEGNKEVVNRLADLEQFIVNMNRVLNPKFS